MRIEGDRTIITALIRPHMEGHVVQALHDLPEFPGFFVTEARGQGRGKARAVRTVPQSSTSHIIGFSTCRSCVPRVQHVKYSMRSLLQLGPVGQVMGSFLLRLQIRSAGSVK